MIETIKLVCIALGGTLAIQLNTFLLKKRLDIPLALLIAAICAIFFTKVIEYLLIELPRKVRFLRRLIDPKSKFEGEWVFTLTNLDHRPYSVVWISYVAEKSTYLLTGRGLNPGTGIKSKWNSTELAFNIEKNEVMYSYESRITDTEADVTSGYGVMKFDPSGKGGKITSGVGFFVDTGGKFFKSSYMIEQLDTNTIASHINKKRFSSNRDIEDFIHKYHGHQSVSGSVSEHKDFDGPLQKPP